MVRRIGMIGKKSATFVMAEILFKNGQRLTVYVTSVL